MSHKFQLKYKDKTLKTEIVKTHTPAVLKDVKSFGHSLFNEQQNTLILGDNLTALKLLSADKDVKNRIRLVYIDPPFATNQVYKGSKDRTATVSKSKGDLKAYDDLLNGPEYIEFLRKRLILLHEIMAKEGSIYVHIDWKMGHYVKIIMDEVFGIDRFINDIARVKCSPKNFNRKAYGNIKDIILFYSKTKNYIWNDSREDLTEEDIERLFPKIDKDGRRYTTTPLHAPGETMNGPTGQLWKGINPPKGRHWRCSPKELDKLDKKGLIEWSSTGNPRKKIYADEILAKGKKRQDIWEFKDHPYPKYPTEKNLEMLKVIIETSSNANDIVLDCFAGSGTTLVASELTGRRWIGIDNSKLAIDTTINKITSLANYRSFKLLKIEEKS